MRYYSLAIPYSESLQFLILYLIIMFHWFSTFIYIETYSSHGLYSTAAQHNSLHSLLYIPDDGTVWPKHVLSWHGNLDQVVIRPIITVAALEDCTEHVQNGSKSFNWLVQCTLEYVRNFVTFLSLQKLFDLRSSVFSAQVTTVRFIRREWFTLTDFLVTLYIKKWLRCVCKQNIGDRQQGVLFLLACKSGEGGGGLLIARCTPACLVTAVRYKSGIICPLWIKLLTRAATFLSFVYMSSIDIRNVCSIAHCPHILF
jgi:hypothetical protein